MAVTADTMIHLGHVSAEGGPLLVLDGSLLGHWRGAYGTGEDYERACGFFDAEPPSDGGLIAIGSGHGLLWDMGGAGTADIFRTKGGDYLIVRTWLELDEDQQGAIARLAGLLSTRQMLLGLIETPSDHGLVVWATEDTSLVTSLRGADGRPEGDWGVEACALAITTEAACYRASHDEVESADGMARRLYLNRA